MRPRSLRDLIERTKQDGDWDHHLREFLDTFYAADGDTALQASFIEAPPDLLGQPDPDAFIGGTGEHLARRWGLPIPRWTRHDARYLRWPLFVPNERRLKGYLIGASPVSFRTRLIFTGPEPLQRARFPYHRGVVRLPLTYPAVPPEGPDRDQT